MPTENPIDSMHDLPPNAAGLIAAMERMYPPLPTSTILGMLSTEADRLSLAVQLTRRQIVEDLKSRYKIL